MLPISITVDVDGIYLDVRVKSVEQESTSSKRGNIDMVREALVLKALNRFLWRNLCTICLQCSSMAPFSASSRSRVPAQDTNTRLLK